MINAMKFAVSVLALTAACLAQGRLTIDHKNNERVSSAEAERIYSSACAVVRQEFEVKSPTLPPVKLVLGANSGLILKAEVSGNPAERGEVYSNHYLGSDVDHSNIRTEIGADEENLGH
jgi:hypothetical protein